MPPAGQPIWHLYDKVLDWVCGDDLKAEWMLDTHPHADLMMALRGLKKQTGAPKAVGEKLREIAKLWCDLYHMPELDPVWHFDRLWSDGDTFKLVNLEVRVMLSTGHTPGSTSMSSAMTLSPMTRLFNPTGHRAYRLPRWISCGALQKFVSDLGAAGRHALNETDQSEWVPSNPVLP